MILTIAVTAPLGAPCTGRAAPDAHSSLTRVVATLGLLITFAGGRRAALRPSGTSVPSYRPTRSVNILPTVPVGLNVVIIFVVGLVITRAAMATYASRPFGLPRRR
jgi:hypothetical protein